MILQINYPEFFATKDVKIDKDIAFKYKEECDKIIVDKLITFHYIVRLQKLDDKIFIVRDIIPYIESYNNIDAIEITNKTLISLLTSGNNIKIQLFLNLYKNYTNL